MSEAEQAIRALYEQIHAGWNDRSGEAFAKPFAGDGMAIGWDGSVHSMPAIASDIDAIFEGHETGRYVGVVKDVRLIGDDAGVLRAIAGLVPPGKSEINPATNGHQTLIAERSGGAWQVVLFQNTPAQFHGRPELVEQLTAELRQVLATRE
jgi:uncharacterized protein (TIGR02246 family)